MDLEIEDINAHLTRLDGEKMLRKLQQYATPLSEKGDATELNEAATKPPGLPREDQNQ